MEGTVSVRSDSVLLDTFVAGWLSQNPYPTGRQIVARILSYHHGHG